MEGFRRVGEKPPLRARVMFHIVAKIELCQRDEANKPLGKVNQATLPAVFVLGPGPRNK